MTNTSQQDGHMHDASTAENFGVGALGGAALGAVGTVAFLSGAIVPAIVGSALGGLIGGAAAAGIGNLAERSSVRSADEKSDGSS